MTIGYDRAMAGARGQRFCVETPTARIHGVRRGRGPVMVLLHGGPGCCDYLADSVLADWLVRAHEVLSYDQRGCRGSHSAGPFTVAANVEDLEAIRRFCGSEQLRLLGHSWGAVLAVHYAAAYPERTAGLVLLSPAGVRSGWRAAFVARLHERHSPEQREELQHIDDEILRTPDRAARAELYRRRFNTALPSYVDPRHRSRAPVLECYNRAVNVQVAASIQAAYEAAGREAGFARYTGPACIIHGRSDPIPWSVVEDLTALLPQAIVAPLEGCGHFPWIEEPEACRAALVAFLGRRG